MENSFSNPQSKYRPAPFWAINHKINPQECARQITEMTNAGMSGGFFHSRAGLITDYMSEEWFECMNAALDAAKNTDGYLWLYDEDLWPSGNAGGQVAMMKPEYRSASLKAYLVAAGQPLPELTEDQAIVFAYNIGDRMGRQLFDCSLLDDVDEAPDSERLLMIREYSPKIGWWSGESYSNLMHPVAMQEFIKLTHEKYKAKLSKDFGKRIPGIFTDEPMLSPVDPNGIHWYDGLPDLYSKWYGRDFTEDLPYLVFDGPECRKIRLLINRTIHRQFMEAYLKPLFDWCEANNLKHTGHFMQENSLTIQSETYGGGVMSFYKYEHVPGIDHLCREVDTMLLPCKQVTSAARQLGRRQVLTEIFGVSRHTNTFEDFKWLGDFDMVFGATFFCPHLSWYSALGKRKRDYPPNWNYQQTYWKDLSKLNDYFARTAWMLDRGEAVCDIAMLHPIDSAVADRKLGVNTVGGVEGNCVVLPVDAPVMERPNIAQLDEGLKKTLQAVLTSGRDCDLVCEDALAENSIIKDGKLTVGKMTYSTLIVPPSITWRPSTFSKLQDFITGGGNILFVGQTPFELDGEKVVEQWTRLMFANGVRSVPCATKQIQEAVDSISKQSFILRDMDGNFTTETYLQHRKEGDSEIFFIVNSSRDVARDYVLEFADQVSGFLMEYDAESGEIHPCMPAEEGLRFVFSLPPCGSVLLALEQTEIEEPEEEEEEVEYDSMKLAESFDFIRSDPNVLVLDRMQVSYDDGKIFDAEDLEFRIRRKIAEKFGTLDALDWQPWVAVRKKLFDGKGGPVILRYVFQSDIAAPKAWAVIEEIQKGKLFINGTEVSTVTDQWQWDRGFGKVEIGKHIVAGNNTLDFYVDYDFMVEVEAAYIVGDFAVELVSPYHGKLVKEPTKLKTGSWVGQGYPFYSGRMIYKAKVDCTRKNAKLVLSRPSASLINVRVNGKAAQSIMWRPYETDLSALVKKGENNIEIEVVSSLQNSFGPLHEINGDDNMWCGPNAFDVEEFIREELSLFDYGLLDGGEILF